MAPRFRTRPAGTGDLGISTIMGRGTCCSAIIGEADVRTSGNRLPQALSRPNRLYLSFFTGSTKFRSHKRLWKSWASLCAKLFLWLAIMDRRWTADRLARRGRPHPESCPLCDQAAESIQHLLINCVVALEVWFHALAKVGLQNIAPMLQKMTYRIGGDVLNGGCRRREKGLQQSIPWSFSLLGPFGNIGTVVSLMLWNRRQQ